MPRAARAPARCRDGTARKRPKIYPFCFSPTLSVSQCRRFRWKTWNAKFLRPALLYKFILLITAVYSPFIKECCFALYAFNMFKFCISIFLQRLLNIKCLNFCEIFGRHRNQEEVSFSKKIRKMLGVGIEIRKRFLLKKQKEVKDEGSKG